MDDTGFNLNASSDRAILLGAVAIVLLFVGCACGAVLGFFVAPVWLVGAGAGGAGIMYGRRGVAEVEAGMLPEAFRGRATTGTILSIVGAVLNGSLLLLMVLACCAGLGFYIFALVASGM